MSVRLFLNYRLPKPNSKEKLSKQRPDAAMPSRAVLAQLSQPEYHAYLHNTILSNLPYYTALARYRDLRNRTAEGRMRGESTMGRKNLRVYFRLTESGLCLLKTGFAKKPKSPV